ncbi:hypothetical protein IQ255_21950 [Pleurocapsales cyanobacterium LEGE 10410]|nr:hypothetical protein [Pleurocapsales cyanobacterium LEGE 10410]
MEDVKKVIEATVKQSSGEVIFSTYLASNGVELDSSDFLEGLLEPLEEFDIEDLHGITITITS